MCPGPLDRLFGEEFDAAVLERSAAAFTGIRCRHPHGDRALSSAEAPRRPEPAPHPGQSNDVTVAPWRRAVTGPADTGVVVVRAAVQRRGGPDGWRPRWWARRKVQQCSGLDPGARRGPWCGRPLVRTCPGRTGGQYSAEACESVPLARLPSACIARATAGDDASTRPDLGPGAALPAEWHAAPRPTDADLTSRTPGSLRGAHRRPGAAEHPYGSRTALGRPPTDDEKGRQPGDVGPGPGERSARSGQRCCVQERGRRPGHHHRTRG